MQTDSYQLRAIVAERDGGHEAKLVELDIAVFGKTIDDVLKEIQHAIIVTFDIATELEQSPFVDILRSNDEIAECLKGATKLPTAKKHIMLPEYVATTLAVALRNRRHPLKINVDVLSRAIAA